MEKITVQSAINSLLKSRRFWLTTASIATTVLAGNKLGLTPDQIQNIVLAIGSLVVGESLRSSQAVTPQAAQSQAVNPNA